LPEAIVKAIVLDGGEPAVVPNAVQATEDDLRIFAQYGAIEPPYQPRALLNRVAQSTLLRPCVDAMAACVAGFGVRLECTLDPDAPDFREKLEQALDQQAMAEGDPDGKPRPDTDAEAATLPARIRAERARIESFLEFACAESSFVDLRVRSEFDEESTGNAYWEVVRSFDGHPCQFVYVPSESMRLMRVENAFVEVEEKRRASPLGYITKKVRRRFRRFVQVLYGAFVAYFKEFGDERVMSARTGHYYANLDELAKREPGAAPATEIAHFRIPFPTTAYGVPRWIGALPSLLGARAADEVNYDYWDNSACPPLAVLVSGGTLANGAADRITSYIQDNLKGRHNHHKILVLEAESGGGSLSGAGSGNRVRIEIRELNRQTDAIFMEYRRECAKDVRQQFRLPPILTGNSDDYNRATSESALAYAEQQVFQHKRAGFDYWANRYLLPALDARYHRLVSNSPVATDSAGVSDALQKLGDYLTVNEGRKIGRDVFKDAHLPQLDDAWANVPPALLKAGVAGPAADGGDLLAGAKRLVQLRAALAEVEGRADYAALGAARVAEAAHVVKVPDAEFASWLS